MMLEIFFVLKEKCKLEVIRCFFWLIMWDMRVVINVKRNIYFINVGYVLCLKCVYFYILCELLNIKYINYYLNLIFKFKFNCICF